MCPAAAISGHAAYFQSPFVACFPYCIAESTAYAYTDRPYLVIPVYMPCSRGPGMVKPVNGHSNTPYSHLKTIKTTRKHFLVFEVH